MEIELKLLMDPEHLDTIRKLPLIEQYVVEAPRVHKLSSTYFDTLDLKIWRNGAGLRVRESDGVFMQALKGGGSVDSGLHRRHEWECRIDGAVPDLKVLQGMVDAGTQWKKMLRSPDLARRLQPIFVTRVTRMTWQLHLPTGDEVEFALDYGTIEHGDETMPICEIELELKSGAAEHLYDFALELHDSVPLRIGNASKAERGYALHAPQTAPIVKASPIKLSRGMTVEQGFSAIIASCLAHVQGNEAGVIDGYDQESVHQMRVGLRRLRSALKLFNDVLPCPPAMLSEVQWLGTELGEARDWDVLSDSTLEKLADAVAGHAEVQQLRQAAQDVAREKHEQASEAVASPRYARLILSMSGWIAGARWRSTLSQQEQKEIIAPIAKFSQKILSHDQDVLRKRGKRLHDADAEKRHRVRIAAKKTRYATEFFQSLYASGGVRSYVGALSKLQDELGWLNDAAVADRLLRRFEPPDSASGELAGSAGFARGYLAARIDQDVPKVTKLWKQFSSVKPPRAK